jgi:hypothetical protein
MNNVERSQPTSVPCCTLSVLLRARTEQILFLTALRGPGSSSANSLWQRQWLGYFSRRVPCVERVGRAASPQQNQPATYLDRACATVVPSAMGSQRYRADLLILCIK